MSFKLLLVAAWCMLSALTLKAVTPPAAVIHAFQTQFPNVDQVSWEKENANEYEATFYAAKIKMSVVYDETGKWIETETAITIVQVPALVIYGFQQHYKDKTIVAIDKIINNKGETHYEFEFKNGFRTKEVLFDKEGNELK